ncbi:hypothetical protein NC651_018503 [Populus alba x Populus x berolinensis]|nr:hypothetical protein NC651_018503 [Populus alba x Populus x berolinensis]
MESWFLILVSISISLFLKIIFNNFLTTKNLPPGPLSFPFIGHLLWLRMSTFKIEPILRSLHAKFGPMVTLPIGTRPAIFVADRTLAHEALIHGGAVFADRPPAVATRKVVTSNQHNISSSFYGPTWRLLRRNLTAEILHLSRVKSYTHARNWVLQILQNRFESQAKAGRPICVMEHFQYAMFCLLVLMCFGDKLDENQIKKIMEVQRQMIVNLSKFDILNFWPGVTKIVLRNRWRELFSHRKCQEDVLIPLIRARKKVKEERVKQSKEDKKEYEDEYVLCYVDTILALELPEEKRKFNEEEMVSLCSEFLNAGTDSTSTALQWIMANLVKHPQIQEKLFMEIKGVVQDGEENIKEEELQKMPYLKATILEGLRRHPPGHFALPHAVTEDVVLGKYVVPRDGTTHFMVAEMGWNPEVWEDPMAFKPERFLNSGGETFDITGSREIKMMPFGAGRRICPAYGLAMLHLEYFVANLIWRFEWKAVDGDDVDLTEKEEFTVVMKNPLQAQICPRATIIEYVAELTECLENLPPGPLSFPFIGHLLWLRMSTFKIEPILRSLHAKFGPMVTLPIGTRPAIFVADRTLAHEALIHGGAVFADRPPAVATRKVVTRVTKIVLRNRWRELFSHRKCQEDVLIPLIRARKKVKEERLPEEKRKLTEGEMVSLCSEFLNAGTDTTSTALQWIMANLVKHPQIQEKLLMEIKGIVQDGEENIKEEDLQKMPYLKATILEGLRRHPPAHFVLPLAVTEDVVLGKYVVPKDGTINFMVAEMGWNPEVWEDPMAFKPERFLNSGGETFDITGSREITMMPFGAGRRICPAYALAILHLEYFVANLIWRFEWNAVDGDDVDLTEKEEFTVVMKNPLQAQICPRLK